MKTFLLVLLTIASFHVAQAQVVCIPGFLVYFKNLSTIERTLQASGQEVHIWNYPSRGGTLWQQAQILCNYMNVLADNRPKEPIDFVAHSIGSVILKAALNLPNCPQEAKIGRTVLLSPCNQGSSLARRSRHTSFVRLIMGPNLGRELWTYNAFEMEQYGDFPDCMELLVIVGNKGSKLLFNEPNDGFLTLRETEINNPHTRYLLPLNHSELLYKRASVRLIRNFICD